MATLGLNVDHTATVRQARRGTEPDPVAAALIGEMAGAVCITVHLREDRRHIQDRDVFLLREVVQTRLNLEMAATEEITKIALDLRPDQATIVPEKREEVTTEGGLDVVANRAAVEWTTKTLRDKGVLISLFIDPDEAQIAATREVGAQAVEFHTGAYANARGSEQAAELERLRVASLAAHALGLQVNAGHGLNMVNVVPVARLPHMVELNIGHSIISRALFVGLERAVREMVELIR
ncbi:pyridoxine 5'-phosphate synthase [Candidatus Sumerlaeota bacterium]|nr:pyridoxine 5'-phosphate synthase [Candidatus Sumerlaeota bacterium]